MHRKHWREPEDSPVKGHRVARAADWRAWWTLCRVQVLATLPIIPRALAGRDKERVDGEEWGLFLLSICGYVPVLALIGWIARELDGDLRLAGQGEALLAVFFVAVATVGVMMGVEAIQSSVYAGRDLALLARLPVPARSVVAAKLAAAAVHQWLALLLFTPFLIVYGLNEQGLHEPARWLFWFKALLVYLLLPFPGLGVAAVLSRVLIPVLGPGRRREGLMAIAGLIAVGLSMAALYDTLGSPAPRGPGTLDPVARAAIALAGFVADYVPPLAWAARALRAGTPAGGAPDLARLGLTAVAGWAVAVTLSERVFQKGLTATGGTLRDRAVPLDPRHAVLAPARSPFRALVWREAVLLLRTPAFFSYSLVSAIVVPMVLLGPGRSTSVFELYREPAGAGLVTWALGGSVLTAITMCVMATHGLTGLGAVSREGRAFWISRVIPVPPRLQLAAKLVFKAGAALVASVPAGILAGLQAGWNAAGWTAWLLGTGLAVTAASATGLALELEAPRLDWTNPKEAHGDRLRPLLALLANLAGLGGMWLVAWLAGELGPWARMGGALVYLLLSAGLAVAGLLNSAESSDARIIPPIAVRSRVG